MCLFSKESAMNKLEQLQKETVEHLVSKYDNEPTHCRHVTKLALIIFDDLSGILHNYGKTERNYLEYAGLLHDVGYHLSYDKHNKNSYKLLMQCEMPGFTREEQELIANIARYHTGKPPKEKHANFKDILDSKTKKLIKELSAFLRIADGLDRSHTDVIQNIKCIVERDFNTCTFILYARSMSCPAELYGANKKKNLFEDHFNMTVDFKIEYT